jgi:hypothetical protein
VSCEVALLVRTPIVEFPSTTSTSFLGNPCFAVRVRRCYTLMHDAMDELDD